MSYGNSASLQSVLARRGVGTIDAFHQAMTRSPTYSPGARALAAELLLRKGMGCCGMAPGRNGMGDAASDLMAQSAAAYNRGDYVAGAQFQQAAALAGGAEGPQTTFAQDAAAFTGGLTAILNPLATAGISRYQQFTGQGQQPMYAPAPQSSTPWVPIIIGGAVIAAIVGIGFAAKSRSGGGGGRRKNPFKPWPRRHSSGCGCIGCRSRNPRRLVLYR